MNRPRYPRSFAIAGLTWNMKTGLYDITEGNVTYSMPLETTRSLKAAFMNNAACKSVSEWYGQLDSLEKKNVIRVGDIPKEESDFTPDPEPEW